jgi:hypothetical protein
MKISQSQLVMPSTLFQTSMQNPDQTLTIKAATVQNST